jgi:hypothetical protein
MPINYKNVFEKREENKGRVLELCPNAPEKPGIYLFWRKDENDIHHGYVGQATKSLLQRIAEHLSGYQHIDLSIKKYGLYDMWKNPHGYHIAVIEECAPEFCDEREQYWIKYYAQKGMQMKNVTIGSQGKGKANFDAGKSTKGYREGVAYGRKALANELRHIIETHNFTITPQKDNKITQKALEKFWALLGIEREDTE